MIQLSTTEILIELSTYSAFPAVLLGLLLKLHKHSSLRYAFLYVTGSLFGDLLGLLTWTFQLNIPFAGYLWPIIHLVAVGLFFQSLKDKSFIPKMSIILLIISLLIVLVQELLPGFSWSKNLINLISIGFALQYFYYLYQTEADLFIERNINFWIACSFFFLHAGQLFSTLLSNQIATTFETYGAWSLYLGFNIFNNLFIAFAFIQHARITRN